MIKAHCKSSKQKNPNLLLEGCTKNERYIGFSVTERDNFNVRYAVLRRQGSATTFLLQKAAAGIVGLTI